MNTPTDHDPANTPEKTSNAQLRNERLRYFSAMFRAAKKPVNLAGGGVERLGADIDALLSELAAESARLDHLERLAGSGVIRLGHSIDGEFWLLDATQNHFGPDLRSLIDHHKQ